MVDLSPRFGSYTIDLFKNESSHNDLNHFLLLPTVLVSHTPPIKASVCIKVLFHN